MLLFSIGLVLLPLAFLDKFLSARIKKTILILFCAYFIFLGGFRWLTGTDWYAYYYEFKLTTSFKKVLSPWAMEFGYSMMNYAVRSFTNSYTIFLLIFTFIKIYLKYKVFVSEFFFKYSLFIFFLFYCYVVGSIYSTRQDLAVSFLFFSIIPIIKRKFWWFLVLVILATSIHRTAIIFIFCYWVFHYSSTQKTLLLVYFASLVGNLIFKNVDASFLTDLPVIKNFKGYQSKLEAYSQLKQVSYGKIEVETSNFLGILKKLFVTLPLILSFNFLRKNLHQREFKIYQGLMNIIVFGSSFYFIFGAMASDFKRMGAYFDIFEVLTIPIMLYNIQNKKLILVLGLYFAVIMLFRLYSAIMLFEDLLDPFYFIFDLPFRRKIY